MMEEFGGNIKRHWVWTEVEEADAWTWFARYPYVLDQPPAAELTTPMDRWIRVWKPVQNAHPRIRVTEFLTGEVRVEVER
jgi:hypothetical protein